MNKVFPCPHCQTLNFATPGRLRQARVVPLKCWKCGKEIKRIGGPPGRGGQREEKKLIPKRKK